AAHPDGGTRSSPDTPPTGSAGHPLGDHASLVREPLEPRRLHGRRGGETLEPGDSRTAGAGSRSPWEAVMLERLRQPGGRLGTLSVTSALALGILGIGGVLTMLIGLVSGSDF